jgi:hypothetical protein
MSPTISRYLTILGAVGISVFIGAENRKPVLGVETGWGGFVRRVLVQIFLSVCFCLARRRILGDQDRGPNFRSGAWEMHVDVWQGWGGDWLLFRLVV